ncbi:hypothetical protein DOY81_001516 [Sarcophaga bullata]|nr:hypothetical protein DOY81_001516 [Sarcophaga bullata]
MTTDETILKEMLERVTNPDREQVDNLAVQMFCMMVQSNSDLVTRAHELIVEKMHSSNITEATRAIGLLEECMSKGGIEFQKKTAKYVFLNELIALVLDKHKGLPVPVETKQRIMECLMLWTVEHEDKDKILKAYKNLEKQVNFPHGPTTMNSTSTSITNAREQRASILGKDDQLVAKLLKQGGEENYKKANLLIQHRFNQEARRTEFICHLKSELKKIESTMELLDEMLNSCTSDVPGADSRDIMQELYNTCKGQNEQMARWPDFLGDAEPEFLEEILNTKDLLMIILHRYKELFESDDLNSKHGDTVETKTTLSKSNATVEKASSDTDLLSELLGEPLNTTSSQDTTPIMSANPVNSSDTFGELNEIFSSISHNSVKTNNTPQHPADLLGNLDLLEPISVFESANRNHTAQDETVENIKNDNEIKKTSGFKELKEIDKLSEEMFKQSLKDEQRLLTFKKEKEKLTLNDLVKDKIQTSLKSENINESKNQTLPLCKTEPTLANTNVMTTAPTAITKDITTEKDNSIMTEKTVISTENTEEKKSKMNDSAPNATLKPLAEINIDLDDVIPLDEGQRLLLNDDDIQVTLNFTADRPSEHVSVIVMAVTNKSKLPVNDFHFEASVKKPCKIRLLPPTAVSMAASKPFRPAAPINQVVLLLNPTQKPVDITCIVGYKLGDDPDPIKESIVAKDIPYV